MLVIIRSEKIIAREKLVFAEFYIAFENENLLARRMIVQRISRARFKF